ncbi:MAG: hypothetical protein ACJASQ_001202 [Crocinitomicaceae bacterium]|jgi:hypothetical protein
MTDQEIIAHYRGTNIERLIELAEDIWSIRAEFRVHLLNELTARNEIELVRKVKVKLDTPIIPKEIENDEKNRFYYLPLILLLLPIGALLDHFVKLSAFSHDPAPETGSLIIGLICATIYFIPVVLAFRKRYIFIWISIGLYFLWTFIFFVIMGVTIMEFDLMIGLELIVRVGLLIYLLLMAVEVKELRNKLKSNKKY